MDQILTWAKDNPILVVLVVFLFWDKIAAFLPFTKPVVTDPNTTPPADPVVVVPATPIVDKLTTIADLIIKFWPLVQPLIPKSADPKMAASQDRDIVRLEAAIDDLKNS